MADLKQIVEEKIARLDSVPDGLVSFAEKHQKKVLESVLKLLDSLEQDNGIIKATADNLKKVEAIVATMNDVLLDEDYIRSVTEFADEYSKQADLTDDYFKKTFTDYSHDPLFDAVIKDSQKQALSLFTQEPVQSQFTEPIRQILKASVTSGSRMQDAIKAISSYIGGDSEKDGALSRYTKQVAYDSFAVFDRSYTNIIAMGLDAEWYKYAGGVIKDSRPFCEEHHGHFYHRKEIESWAFKDWAGKRQGTNGATIFQYAGGYNCKHSILPVSESAVPAPDIQRAKDKGYIK